jgi:thioredoxin-related protein
MRSIFKIAGILMLVLSVQSNALAAQLVMIDSKMCRHCAAFNRQVGSDYDKTKAGRKAPLRRVSILRKWPSDLAGVKRTTFTPVFILVDQGREVGRFYGFIDAATFYADVNNLLRRF